MTQESSPIATPAAIWPLTETGRAAAPQHPLLRAVYRAIRPLTPLLRELTFAPDAEKPGAVLGLGAVPYTAGVLIYDDDTLLVDLPVGLVPQTAENMHTLLSLNSNRDWSFRVDTLEEDGPEPQALVVIEYRLPLTQLDRLPGKILEGWREKRMADGLIHVLNGGGDWL